VEEQKEIEARPEAVGDGPQHCETGKMLWKRLWKACGAGEIGRKSWLTCGLWFDSMGNCLKAFLPDRESVL